jgi:hypothetical protein
MSVLLPNDEEKIDRWRTYLEENKNEIEPRQRYGFATTLIQAFYGADDYDLERKLKLCVLRHLADTYNRTGEFKHATTFYEFLTGEVTPNKELCINYGNALINLGMLYIAKANELPTEELVQQG